MSFLRACEGFGQGTTRVAQSHGTVLCFYPSPTCVFGLRAIESKEQGVREEKEMAIADEAREDKENGELSMFSIFRGTYYEALILPT
ncbi:hypothetical protein JHK87_035223 [Glycine soja]|nr:hypothetical protein JHK87_035223 [Glycine soja]